MTNNVNIRNPGNYTVTYTTTDPSGNTATATRHVNVISGRPPIDLAATKTLIHTGTIIAGDTFAYRFNIKNVGSSTFSGTVE